MPQIYPERMIPQLDGDFVVFLIGLRINKPWKVHKWWPVMSAMPRMLKELDRNPELGCLGYITGFTAGAVKNLVIVVPLCHNLRGKAVKSIHFTITNMLMTTQKNYLIYYQQLKKLTTIRLSQWHTN